MSRGPVRRLSLSALLLLVTLSSPARAQEAAAMDAGAFARMLADLATQIGSGEPGRVPAVRVPAVWAVDVRGQRYEVPAGWLSHQLDSARRDPSTWPAQRSRLIARLDALRREAEALGERATAERPQPDPDAARAALGGVLARPEFRQMAQQNALTRVRERVLDWIARILERLAGGPLGRRGTAVALAWILTALTAVALAVLVARAFMRPARRPTRPDAWTPEHSKTARAWARDALEASDAREAVRCAYRAVVAGLEEEGTWRRDDALTPREYTRLLAAGHRRRALFTDISRRFEEVWFAARTATDDDRSAVMARLKELGCLPAA